MASTDLQQQCTHLLSQLKANQASLWQRLGTAPEPSSSQDNNLETHLSDQKPEYARQKLKSIMKNKHGHASDASEAARPVSSATAKSKKRARSPKGKAAGSTAQPRGKSGAHSEEELKRDKSNLRPPLTQGDQDECLDTDKMHDYFESRTTNSLMEGGTDSFSGAVSIEDNTRPQFAEKPTTPVSVRRRRIIDRHVHVDSKLSEADMQELERNTRGLNFSYSQSLEAEEDPAVTCAQKPEKEGGETMEEGKEEEGGGGGDSHLTYQKCLVDRGNNRQLNNFIRDTTIKPRTVLNSTHNYSKQGPGVSFQNSSNSSGNSSLFRSQNKERRMLGYDWIAALVNNDTGLMDESESYFHELREFRRSNRDECCNDFYMEGPFTLTETEPPAVEKAIKDTKVQPYTVNDRLFTVPVTENLLGEPLDPGNKEKGQEPTQEEPRFVRVSIPRSTLIMPYKVRPHRRRSFDASDSCSLRDHCLMGWNAVSPATLPTASGVSLTDAMTGVNPKHTTTLAEAEKKTACMHHWPLVSDRQVRPEALPTWRKQYLDATTNFLPLEASSSLSLSSSLGGAGRQVLASGDVQRKTDELLSSTYSMMYQMQKTRELREEEQRRQQGKWSPDSLSF